MPEKIIQTRGRSIKKQPAFLAAFAISASVTAAAAAVGCDKSLHYHWIKTDPAYVAAFAAAKVEAAQTLVDSAVERSLVGLFEPTVYQGRFCYPQEEYEAEPAKPARPAVFGVDAQPAVPAVIGWRDVPGAPPIGVYKRSEMLHLALLKAWVPEFAPRSAVEVSGPGGGPIEIVERLNAARERLAPKE